jgi:hypothetical protein
MQIAEGCDDGIFLDPGDQARTERLTWHFGHGDQGRVRVQVGPDGPRRESRRIAGEQRQCPPLATRLITIEPPLVTTGG